MDLTAKLGGVRICRDGPQVVTSRGNLGPLANAGARFIDVELASLPEIVRGYEDVKLGNVARYKEALAALGL